MAAGMPSGGRRVPDIRRFWRQPSCRPLWALSAWVLLCLLIAAPVSQGFTKLLPPLVYEWDRQVKGDRLYLILNVTATSRLSYLAIDVGGGLSDNLSPQGQTQWRGPLEAGKKAILILWVPVGANGVVDARLDGVTASNVHFSHGSRTHVPKAPAIAPPAPRPPAAPPAPRVREFLVK